MGFSLKKMFKKTIRKVAKKLLPDKYEKAFVGPTGAEYRTAAEAEAARTEAKQAEKSTREDRERASRRRARRRGRRQLLSYGRLGASAEDENQKKTLG
jgi:hypothetical protein